MKNYKMKRSFFALLIVISLVSGLVHFPVFMTRAEAKTKLSMTVRVDSKKVNKKTITMKKGSSKKIKLSLVPNQSGIKTKYTGVHLHKRIKVIVPKKKNYKITFRSSKGSVVTVTKTGKITAKKIGTAKITVIAGTKKKKYKSWIKVKVVSADKKSDVPLPTKNPIPSQTVTPSYAPTATPPDTATVEPSDTPMVTPSDTPTVVPSDTPSVMPSVTPTTTPTESPAPDTGTVSDMYEITVQVNGKVFPAKLYQTETTKSIMQKLPLSIMMDELNGNEKYYYFSESFPTASQKVSDIHAGDLKLYGSSCLVLFYESFSTSYSYTSLGFVENPEGLAEALGTGSVRVDIFSSE